MDFKNIFSAWGNDGKEPSEELQLSGFKGGQKPAASVFNWFWSKVMKAVTELQTKLTSVDNNKAEKYNFSGGFIGGDEAAAESGGAVGQNAYTTAGGAVGSAAFSGSGFAGGELAKVTNIENNVEIPKNGGAVGFSAKTDDGFAGGSKAESKNGGGAAGSNAKTNAGGAVGLSAMAYDYGGAVGNGAIAGYGFSGGYNAKVKLMEGYSQKYIDAIQLGSGTNNNKQTLQVYNHTLMNADGTIPAARIPDGMIGIEIKGIVPNSEELPAGPAPGDAYIIVSNAVFYTGPEDELLHLEPVDGTSRVTSLKITPPEECIEPENRYVCAYDIRGNKIGSISYEGGISGYGWYEVESFGVEYPDLQASFYLGKFQNGGFPESLTDSYAREDIVYWDGTAWKTLDESVPVINQCRRLETFLTEFESNRLKTTGLYYVVSGSGDSFTPYLLFHKNSGYNQYQTKIDGEKIYKRTAEIQRYGEVVWVTDWTEM